MILDAVIIMSIRHERVLHCINIQNVKSNTREHNVELLHDIYRLICIRVVLDMKHCTSVITVTEFNTISYTIERRKNGCCWNCCVFWFVCVMLLLKLKFHMIRCGEVFC